MSDDKQEKLDPKIEVLYQTCLQFLRDFGTAPSGVSRKMFSAIYVQYYICLKDDHNMPLADEYLDLDDEYCEGLDAVKFVQALAKYYYKKLTKEELMPYG